MPDNNTEQNETGDITPEWNETEISTTSSAAISNPEQNTESTHHKRIPSQRAKNTGNEENIEEKLITFVEKHYASIGGVIVVLYIMYVYIQWRKSPSGKVLTGALGDVAGTLAWALSHPAETLGLGALLYFMAPIVTAIAGIAASKLKKWGEETKEKLKNGEDPKSVEEGVKTEAETEGEGIKPGTDVETKSGTETGQTTEAPSVTAGEETQSGDNNGTKESGDNSVTDDNDLVEVD